jgi:serine protease Do
MASAVASIALDAFGMGLAYATSMRRLAFALLFGVVVLCRPVAVTAQKPVPAAPDALDRYNESIDALIRRVWPSVVQIQVTGYGAREEGVRGDVSSVITRQRSVGSGFVIDPDGYILTNAHVVSGAQRVQVVLPPVDAQGAISAALSGKTPTVPARIVGITTEIDLAVLKIDGVKLPALPLASYKQLRQGETVFAFGSPSGLRNTLTHGLVSAVARQTDPDSPLI